MGSFLDRIDSNLAIWAESGAAAESGNDKNAHKTMDSIALGDLISILRALCLEAVVGAGSPIGGEEEGTGTVLCK